MALIKLAMELVGYSDNLLATVKLIKILLRISFIFCVSIYTVQLFNLVISLCYFVRTDEGSRAKVFCFSVCFDAMTSSIIFKQVKST